MFEMINNIYIKNKLLFLNKNTNFKLKYEKY